MSNHIFDIKLVFAYCISNIRFMKLHVFHLSGLILINTVFFIVAKQSSLDIKLICILVDNYNLYGQSQC